MLYYIYVGYLEYSREILENYKLKTEKKVTMKEIIKIILIVAWLKSRKVLEDVDINGATSLKMIWLKIYIPLNIWKSDLYLLVSSNVLNSCKMHPRPRVCCQLPLTHKKCFLKKIFVNIVWFKGNTVCLWKRIMYLKTKKWYSIVL